MVPTDWYSPLEQGGIILREAADGRAARDLRSFLIGGAGRAVLKQFGFAESAISTELFLKKDQVIRMGLPPLRIELLTSISGVSFADCYAHRTIDEVDGVQVHVISLSHLKINKKAAGRLKDLSDLEHLP